IRLSPRLPPRTTRLPYTPLFRSALRRDVAAGRPARCRDTHPMCGVATRRPPSPTPAVQTPRGTRGRGGRRRLAGPAAAPAGRWRSEEHTSELQSRENLVCRLLLE